MGLADGIPARATPAGALRRNLLGAVLVGLLAVAGTSERARAATIGIGNARGYPGEVSTVPFSVREATNLVAAQFDIGFNVAKGGLSSPILVGRNSNAVVRSREVAPGVRRVLVYTPNNAMLRSNGFAGRFSFGIVPGERVGSGPITPMNGVLSRADGTRIAATTLSSGTVFVLPFYRDPESGLVDLFFPSVPEHQYVVQASEDLVRWVNVSTNFATSDFVDLVDTDAPVFPYRFYRTTDMEARTGIASIRQLPGGGVVVDLPARDREGGRFLIEASEDLVTWRDLAVRPSVDGVVSWTEPAANETRRRFYRLKSVP